MTQQRRVCWPNPDATCLNGGCQHCNTYPFRNVSSIERYAERAGVLPHRGQGCEEDAYAAFLYGQLNNWCNAESRDR